MKCPKPRTTQETFHRRKYTISLNLFLRYAEMDKNSWEFSPLPNITITQHNLSEGSRYLQYVNILMSWMEVNKTMLTLSLKYFPSNCAPLNTTEEGETKMMSIHHSLQELGLCLLSINHYMVTGGGPPVNQPTPEGWPQGRSFPKASAHTKRLLPVPIAQATEVCARPGLSSSNICTSSILE